MMKVLLSLLVLLLATPAWAVDWQVDRVRGTVTQNISGSWQVVSRGDVIPDDRYLKTGADGRIGLARGNETIELQGDTQIRIIDAGADRMTTVLQDFGTVSIEAEKRNVQHFSVQTPFLAAVVKGTRFTVRSDDAGASVQVERGVVQVQDTVNDLVADVRPGQEALVSNQAPLLVEGAGAISVFSFDGAPVVNGTTTQLNGSKAAGRNAAGQGNALDPDKNAAGTGGVGPGSRTNGATSNAASRAASSVGNAASSAEGGVVNAASSAATSVGDAASSAASSVSNVSSDAAANAGSAAAASAGAAEESAQRSVESVSNAVSAAAGALGNGNAGNGNSNALGLRK